MAFLFSHRLGHYLVLVVAHLLLTLPNLGRHTLWDMDEGVNAEAAREMLERNDWTTPYFNYQLRTAKPVLLYWLQGPSMLAFGVNEWAARFPSVLCGLVTVLLTYELARRMFAPRVGLWAGLILTSCIEFCLLSHAATPDAPLLMFFMAALTLYWFGSQDGRTWWYTPVGIAVGCATLTKGPIGIALPGAIIGLHLLAARQYRTAFSWRLLLLFGAFLLTAGPWYGLVAADTRGKWIETFIMKENIGRFSTPQENHRGNPLFHPLLFVVLFAPWSIFLGVTFWNAIREARKPATDMLRPAYRLLLIWFAVVLVVFSIAATKLPNYILPLYPATAIMTACALERWRSQVDHWPRYIVWGVALGWGLVGLVTVLGILIAAGTLTLPIKGVTPMPALAPWAGLGGILVVSAVAFAATVRRCRTRALVSLVVGSVGFLAGIAAFPTVAMNAYKAPRPLVEEFHLRNPTTEFRLGGFHWLRESAVFYAQREIVRLDSAKAANEFLELDIPSYVFVPAKRWEEQRPFVTVPCEVLGRHYDMYARDDILILANPPGVALFRQHGP